MSHYDIDGFHWDYLRYPNQDSGYNEKALKRYNAVLMGPSYQYAYDYGWKSWSKSSRDGKWEENNAVRPFLLDVKVVLKETPHSDARVQDSKKISYRRQVGVAYETRKEAIKAMSTLIDDGEIDWENTDFIPTESLESNIGKRFLDCKTNSVWYLSDRCF